MSSVYNTYIVKCTDIHFYSFMRKFIYNKKNVQMYQIK